MFPNPDDIAPRPLRLPPQPTEPLATPIYPSSVYRCAGPAQAEALLAGTLPGHVYSRDGHPNAQLLAERCRLLHGAEQAAVVASGMSALSAALLSQCAAGDRIVVSRQLYGRSHLLLIDEAARLGITATAVETTDFDATSKALAPENRRGLSPFVESAEQKGTVPLSGDGSRIGARLLVVETISNPLLRVADLARLAELAHAAGARLLVDNTFASPVLCRPLELGADLVVESLTKIMNGHSDVLLGLLCGRGEVWQRVPKVISTWGLTAGPFECWLAERGIGTLPLRMERAAANASAAARFLQTRPEVATVHYPGLPDHPDYALATRQFGGRYGSIVAFTLAGDTPAAERFIAGARDIPFCPSLGELSTTLTHPASTSHRGLSPEARCELGILGGTIRLSVGVESPEFVISALTAGLEACG